MFFPAYDKSVDISLLKSKIGNTLFSSKKRVLGTLLGLVLVLSIPLTLTLVSQQQDIRQRASETAGLDGYTEVNALPAESTMVNTLTEGNINWMTWTANGKRYKMAQIDPANETVGSDNYIETTSPSPDGAIVNTIVDGGTTWSVWTNNGHLYKKKVIAPGNETAGSDGYYETTTLPTGILVRTIVDGNTSWYVWTDNGTLYKMRVGGANTDTPTPVPPEPVLPAPTGITATAVSKTQINLSWNASIGAPFVYMANRCTGSECTSTVNNTINLGANTTYSDNALTCGTTYGYSLYAINTAGTGATSTWVYATTSACAGPTPTGTGTCGDGVCSSQESWSNSCPQDCPVQCGRNPSCPLWGFWPCDPVPGFSCAADQTCNNETGQCVYGNLTPTPTTLPQACNPDGDSAGTITGSDLLVARNEILGIASSKLASCMTPPDTDATTGTDVLKIRNIILGITNN